MSLHSWTRWLGPVALLVALLAVVFVVTSSMGGSQDGSAATSTNEQEETRTGTTTGTATADEPARTSTTPQTKPRTYRVRAGDNLGTIAERTGVSVEELQELNPTVDPQALTVGQKIKLAE